MIKVDNISFNGKFRYMGATINSLAQVPLFEVGKNKAPEELIVFAEKSKFLNQLKIDHDVFLHHHIETPENKTTQRNGFLSKLFSNRKKYNNETAKEHLTVVFEYKKANTIKKTELCGIHISLPINDKEAQNIDRFEKVLEDNSDIYMLKKRAHILFPGDTHKLTMLPKSNNKGWAEFWVGEKNAFDTLDRLMIAFYQQMIDMSKKSLQTIQKNHLGL